MAFDTSNNLSRSRWVMLLAAYVLSERGSYFTRLDLMKFSGLLSWGHLYHLDLNALVSDGYFSSSTLAGSKTFYYELTPSGRALVQSRLLSLDYLQYS